MSRTHLSPLPLLLLAALPAGATPAHFITTSETVTDSSTGLVWQRSVPASSYTWAGAKAYCDALSLAGATDWRLPSMKELQSIVDRSRVNPAIDPAAFPSTPSDYFWSSSAFAFYSTNAWYVYFYNGFTNGSVVSNTSRVRCVR